MTIVSQNYQSNNYATTSNKKDESTSTQTNFEVSSQKDEEEQQAKSETTTEETKVDYEYLWKLVRDIDSVSRTGFTVEELEYLQKLIAQLQKLISEQADNSAVEPDIQDKIDEIQKLIIQMQKKVSGEAIIEMDDGSCPTSDKESALDTLTKLDHIVNKMKSGSEKNDIKSLSTIEELQLSEYLREKEKLEKKN